VDNTRYCSPKITWRLLSTRLLFILLIIGCSGAAPHALQRDIDCHSVTSENMAILHIDGGELEKRHGLDASGCGAACCLADTCTAWTLSCPRSTPNVPTCYLKNSSREAIASRIREHVGNVTSGCIDSACPLPTRLLRPQLTLVHTIASLPRARLRDPTTALFDPVTTTWHVFASHKPLSETTHHYTKNVTIRHFVLRSGELNFSRAGQDGSLWEDEGAALNASGVEGAFDASAVYTPGAAVECTQTTDYINHNNRTSEHGQIQTKANTLKCRWYLWFGGVTDQGPLKNESIGVAVASSPFGPFVRYEGNPVFSTMDSTADWCGDEKINGRVLSGSGGGSGGGESGGGVDTSTLAARVDEIKPLSLRGIKYLAVKCVCKNFTALPVFYSPVNQESWAPPYTPSHGPFLQSPMVGSLSTCAKKGFEEPTFFIGPDGFLHFLGHDHGSCGDSQTYQHLYRSWPPPSTDHQQQHHHHQQHQQQQQHHHHHHGQYQHESSPRATPGGGWKDGGRFSGSPSHPWFEPNPVPRDGTGVFGDRTETGVPLYWIDFGQWGAWQSNISLMRAEWVSVSG
jgi:hypothetical protein